MWRFILLSTLMAMLAVTVDAAMLALSSNPDNFIADDAQNNCRRKVDNEFRGMKKSKKVFVNGREIGFYGFDSSAEHLIELDMSKTGIMIPFHNTSFQNLMILRAAFNNYRQIVDGIGNETFPSLRILNFSHNALDSFSSRLLEHMKEIEILDFSHNCIDHIRSSSSFRLRNVREIHLQHNLIKTLRMWPHSDSEFRLRALDVSHNRMIEFSDSKIMIEHLNVAHNKLSSLKIHHASRMNLDASYNQLKQFGDQNEGTFHLLNLSHNSFEALTDVMLKVATTLDLSHNRISATLSSSDEIDNDSNSEFEHDDDDTIRLNRIIIVNLNLSFNFVRKVSEISRHFDVKKMLFLDNNRMSGLDFEVFKKSFPTIQRVSLSGNPLTRADETELKFHNNTQLLSIHFGYDFATKAPPTTTSSPPTTESFVSTFANATSNGGTATERNSTSLDCARAKSISLTSTEPPAAAKATSKSTNGAVEQDQSWFFIAILSLAAFAVTFVSVLVLFIYLKPTLIKDHHARLIVSMNDIEYA